MAEQTKEVKEGSTAKIKPPQSRILWGFFGVKTVDRYSLPHFKINYNISFFPCQVFYKIKKVRTQDKSPSILTFRRLNSIIK